ncbi:Putative carbonic anhydrase 5, partial [Toxocara canis]
EVLDGFLNWPNVPTVTGGGLGDRYKLRQIHFHWGSTDNSGSEHTIGHLHYPLEAHLVHIRNDLSESQAANTTGGTIVFAVFFTIGTVGKPFQQLEQALNATVGVGM